MSGIMDDWLFLCNSSWYLRKAVKNMHHILARLNVKIAENKTFIGRVNKGYDWLGYRIELVLEKTKNRTPFFALFINATSYHNHLTKLCRLYEQGASKEALAAYAKRWWIWVRGGVGWLG